MLLVSYRLLRCVTCGLLFLPRLGGRGFVATGSGCVFARTFGSFWGLTGAVVLWLAVLTFDWG